MSRVASLIFQGRHNVARCIAENSDDACGSLAPPENGCVPDADRDEKSW
jgi:hypothetical protein